jgi:hypothetical protein
VLQFLDDQSFTHAPLLLLTRAGEVAASTVLGDAIVMEHVPHPLREDEPDSWLELGAVAATLNGLRGFGEPFVVDVVSAFDEIRAHAVQHGRPAEIEELLAHAAPLQDAPRDAFVHGEINGANARRRGDGTIVLLDWDQAGDGAPALDLGYPLVTTFMAVGTNHFDAVRAAAFATGYQSAGGRIDPEATFAAAVFHALRYLWFADTERRLARLDAAVRRREDVMDAVTRAGATGPGSHPPSR